MQRFTAIAGFRMLAVSACLSAWASPAVAQRSVEAPAPSLDLPLTWVENRGQWPEQIACASLGGKHAAALWNDRLRVRVGESDGGAEWLDLKFPSPVVRLEHRGAGTPVSFFLGSERDRWHGGVASWSVVRAAVLPGIDVVLRDSDIGIRYDLELAPHADLEAMTFEVRDAESLTVDGQGRLLMVGPFGEVVQTAPIAWQPRPGGLRDAVACAFEVVGDRTYRFRADEWQRDLPLVIDPTVVVGPDYATWFANTNAIDVGGNGDLYLCGDVFSTPFPGGFAVHDLGNDISSDALFVARLSQSSSTPVGIALFGGSGIDHTFSLDLDASEQEVLVPFSTRSTDFPVTDATAVLLDGNQHAGLMAIDAATLSSVRFSTILPEGNGPAYVRTISPTSAIVTSNAPGTPQVSLPQWGPCGGSSDVIAWWVDLPLGAPLRGYRVGGSDNDGGAPLVVGGDGSIYWLIATGATSSTPAAGLLPTTPGAFHSTPTFASSDGSSVGRGKKTVQSTFDWDGFLIRFDPTLTTVEYATRLGGTGFDTGGGSDGEGCTVQGARVALFGRTQSPDFEPTLGGALDGARDGWVLELDFTGFTPVTGQPAIVYGQYFGGGGEDSVNKAEFDAPGRLHLAGSTRFNGSSGNGRGRNRPPPPNPFPVLDNGSGLFKATPAVDDGFYAVLDPTGTLLYSSPIGSDDGEQRINGFKFGPAGELCFLVFDWGTGTLPTTPTAVFSTPPSSSPEWIAVFPPRL